MIPICLTTGFLGTGKTTLLKRIAEQNRERKLTYLINEFSALDVDGAIVSEANPDVVSIPGGSIFCKCLVTEFIGQMTRIHEQHGDIEGVVIEASGMADPRVIADMLRETGLEKYYKLSTVISVVEPRSFLRLIHTLPNILHQIEAADLILLNKCDLYDDRQLEETEQAVLNIKADADIMRCVEGDAAFALFGHSDPHADLHGEYAKCRDPRYSSFVTEGGSPIDYCALERVILKNEEDIYRVKGTVCTQDGPLYFDYSGAGFSHEKTGEPAAYGLAWICRNNTADRIREQVLSLIR